jgi:hypothetical protein
MSAKHSRRSAKKAAAASASSVPAPAVSPVASVKTAPALGDSADPRKRTIARIALAGIWIYVAALWLLALDQTFHWGIFGPKVPPVP